MYFGWLSYYLHEKLLNDNYKLNRKCKKLKKDYLTKLSVRKLRLEAKKSSINLYNRKNKEELIELILKDRKKNLTEDKFNDANNFQFK